LTRPSLFRISAAVPGTLMRRCSAKLGGLLLAVGVITAACSPGGPPPKVAISVSGQLVIQVVDSSQDVGRYPQVVLGKDGEPQVTYLLLVHKLKKGEIPQPIVAGTPQPTAVMLATQTNGVWLRQSATPQSTAPAKGDAPELADAHGYFKPGVSPALVLDAGGKHHIAYRTPDGLFYTDDTGTNFTVPVKVADGPTYGASIAVASDGTPWISFYQGSTYIPRVAHRVGT
jgi:hypothetical protein